MTRTRSCLALALGVLVLVSGWALPAAAQADGLSVSLDGRTWSATAQRPLFDPDRRWVPGDVQTVPVWVRNENGTDSVLTVQLTDAAVDPRLGLDLAHALQVDGRRLGWGQRHPVRHEQPVAKVELRLELPETAGNDSQARPATFGLRLTATEATPATPATPAAPATPTDRLHRLARTGGPAALVAGAGLGCLAGALVLLRRRRRPHPVQEPS